MERSDPQSKRLIGSERHPSFLTYRCKAKRFTEAKKRHTRPRPSGFGGTYFLRFAKEWGSKCYVRFSQPKGETARANTKAKSSRGKAKGKGLWLTCPNPIGKTNHAIQCVRGSAILSAPYEDCWPKDQTAFCQSWSGFLPPCESAKCSNLKWPKDQNMLDGEAQLWWHPWCLP